MINVGPIRAAARATAGDVVGLDKRQLEQLLAEVEEGQRARRELRMLSAVAGGYRAGIAPFPASGEPQKSAD